MSINVSPVPAEPSPHTEVRDERPSESPDRAAMIDEGEGIHELVEAHLHEHRAVRDALPGDALSERDALALQLEEEQRERSIFPIADQRVAPPVDDEYLLADQHAVELQLQEVAARMRGSRGPLGGPALLAPAGEDPRDEADRVAR